MREDGARIVSVGIRVINHPRGRRTIIGFEANARGDARGSLRLGLPRSRLREPSFAMATSEAQQGRQHPAGANGSSREAPATAGPGGSAPVGTLAGRKGKASL